VNQTPSIGTTIDHRYQLRRELAVGGMATVYEARHVYTGQRVAIKLLHNGDPTSKARLLREAAVFQGARHRALVDVLDAGEAPDTGPYLVMELLEGRSLETLLATRHTLGFDEVVRIGASLCDALAFVHARGMLHRDVKPGNVFLVGDEPPQIKLIDFGIVAVPSGDKLTRESQAPGTPEYMAPEHVRQEPLDGRSDVYSLGATLFECLTGTLPMTGTYTEILVQLAQPGEGPRVNTLRPEVPPALAAAVERAIARDATNRFPDMTTFAMALRQITDLPSKRETPTIAQRRVFARAAYGTPVRLVRSDGSTLDGRSEDVSEGGLLLLAERSVIAGELVQVRFASPVAGTIVTMPALVRWVRPGRGGKAVLGCSFTDLNDALRQEIGRYVQWMGDPAAPPEAM
jgi:serine/threonine protein kinase